MHWFSARVYICPFHQTRVIFMSVEEVYMLLISCILNKLIVVIGKNNKKVLQEHKTKYFATLFSWVLCIKRAPKSAWNVFYANAKVLSTMPRQFVNEDNDKMMITNGSKLHFKKFVICKNYRIRLHNICDSLFERIRQNEAW